MNTRNNQKMAWNFPRLVFGIFLVFFCVLIIQLCYLSLSPSIYGINMKEFSNNRNNVKSTLKARRGNILDINGNVFAMNVTSYTVIAYLDESRTGSSNEPKHVVDKEETAKQLSEVLDMDYEYLLGLLNKDVYQVELGPGGRGITELKKDEIESLSLPGIDFTESSKRYYPNGDFASYVIGYVRDYENTTEDGKIITSTVGELGIESKYDDNLKGVDGYLEYQRDLQGYKIPDTKETRVEAKNGNDIYLTIDTSIQMFVEDAVKSAYSKYKPEWLMVGVMDAKTGDVLSMSVTPSFDPNIKNISNYQNLFVSGSYEPGSVMKIYTYLCAIDKGTYDGSAKYKSGSVEVLDSKISDWDKKGWGYITYDKGFTYSSNVGVVNMLNNFIDKNDLKACLQKYGFGEVTGIELSGEASGKLDFTYAVEVANAGFGQGITTTAIQQLQGLTILSNDGKMLKPHIISKIVDSNTNEIIYERKIEESEQLVSSASAKKVRELMNKTVNTDDTIATGRKYKMDGFDLIGKTGTAQIYNVKTGKYSTNSYDSIYSFAGMFPYDDPQYIIYVAMKRPSTGTNKALPVIVNSVISSIAKYKNMFSENESKDKTLNIVDIPSYLNKNIDIVKKEIEDLNLNAIILGNGNKVINQYPKINSKVLENDKILLVTNSSEYEMPDIKGWSKKEVKALFDLINIDYEIKGNGFATSSSLKTGEKFKAGDKVTITLEGK